MLQVARLAPKLLGESRDLVARFLHGGLNPDGGFGDRAGDSDLYYTVFGLEGLLALQEPLPESTITYLRGFGGGNSLDFVHLTCLARAWGSASKTGPPEDVRAAIEAGLTAYRSLDGGFAVSRSAETGTAYACFLATGAYEDLGGSVDTEGLLRCLDGMRASDGGYANHPGALEGSTPATAAAVTLMHHIGAPVPHSAVMWLRTRCHPDGGFFAAPRAPLPDLLSTATALHALAAVHADTTALREPCLDFVDTLWTNTGAFCGSWADATLDCEYTYYGLLALGHLSL